MLTKEQFLSFKQNYPLDSLKASQRRDEAFEAFLKAGWPTKKDEAWKYTSLNHLNDQGFQIPSVDEKLNHEDMKWIAQQLNEDFINIVFTNGFFNATLSDEVDDLLEISEVSTQDFDFVVETEQKVLSLAHAFSHQKMLLHINKKNQTEKVIQITFAQTGNQPSLVNLMTEVNLDKSVSAKIILNYISQKTTKDSGPRHLLSSDVKINMSEKSRLQFLQVQNEFAVDTHLSRVVFELADYAHLTTLDLALGSLLARHYTQVNFYGEHAVAGVSGVIASSHHQHSDHYTFINHAKGHNHSVQKYKSILADQSHSIFRGRIRIEPNAQKAISEQLNNSLMISREAQVSSIPQLEIYADDVKAGHGSTVGQLSKDEMFYFLSRGVDQVQATKMLAYGFVLEMTSVFEDAQMQKKVEVVLNDKLNGMFV